MMVDLSTGGAEMQWRAFWHQGRCMYIDVPSSV